MSSGKARRKRATVMPDDLRAELPKVEGGIRGFMDEVARAGEKAGRPAHRPKGSLNRKTRETQERWSEEGLADPLFVDGAIASLDPVAYQRWLAENDPTIAGETPEERLKAAPSLMSIMRYQSALRQDLRPYLHGKMPTRIIVDDERLPTFIVDLGTDKLTTMRDLEDRKAMSLTIDGEAEKANEINDGEDEK